MEMEVWIDVGIDILFLVLHALHLKEWILILKGRRQPNKNNMVLLSVLCGIEGMHLLADEVLLELHMIENPFVGIRLGIKILTILFYFVFFITELICYRKDRKKGTDAEAAGEKKEE